MKGLMYLRVKQRASERIPVIEPLLMMKPRVNRTKDPSLSLNF